jgi:hypothetical protein
MMYVYEIRKMFKCSTDVAWSVYVLMDIDFSECSNDEFKAAAKRAWEMVKCQPIITKSNHTQHNGSAISSKQDT